MYRDTYSHKLVPPSCCVLVYVFLLTRISFSAALGDPGRERGSRSSGVILGCCIRSSCLYSYANTNEECDLFSNYLFFFHQDFQFHLRPERQKSYAEFQLSGTQLHSECSVITTSKNKTNESYNNIMYNVYYNGLERRNNTIVNHNIIIHHIVHTLPLCVIFSSFMYIMLHTCAKSYFGENKASNRSKSLNENLEIVH